jgi:hypothetical protein
LCLLSFCRNVATIFEDSPSKVFDLFIQYKYLLIVRKD